MEISKERGGSWQWKPQPATQTRSGDVDPLAQNAQAPPIAGRLQVARAATSPAPAKPQRHRRLLDAILRVRDSRPRTRRRHELRALRPVRLDPRVDRLHADASDPRRLLAIVLGEGQRGQND